MCQAKKKLFKLIFDMHMWEKFNFSKANKLSYPDFISSFGPSFIVCALVNELQADS
jgi:hypothetical protein